MSKSIPVESMCVVSSLSKEHDDDPVLSVHSWFSRPSSLRDAADVDLGDSFALHEFLESGLQDVLRARYDKIYKDASEIGGADEAYSSVAIYNLAPVKTADFIHELEQLKTALIDAALAPPEPGVDGFDIADMQFERLALTHGLSTLLADPSALQTYQEKEIATVQQLRSAITACEYPTLRSLLSCSDTPYALSDASGEQQPVIDLLVDALLSSARCDTSDRAFLNWYLTASPHADRLVEDPNNAVDQLFYLAVTSLEAAHLDAFFKDIFEVLPEAVQERIAKRAVEDIDEGDDSLGDAKLAAFQVVQQYLYGSAGSDVKLKGLSMDDQLEAVREHLRSLDPTINLQLIRKLKQLKIPREDWASYLTSPSARIVANLETTISVSDFQQLCAAPGSRSRKQKKVG